MKMRTMEKGVQILLLTKLDPVVAKFDEYFSPRKNLPYTRFRPMELRLLFTVTLTLES